MESKVAKIRGLRSMLLAGALMLCAGSGAASAADALVKIDNFTFGPQTLTVPVGTTVTFENDDDIPHVVVEKEGKFRSKALDTGDKFTQQFTAAGTVEYYCAIHPMMTGKIVVTP